MALAETAKLIVNLSLAGNFTQQLKSSERALGSFNAKLTDTQGRAYKAGQQIGTGIKNAAKIAVVGISALTGLFILSAKEGQNAANVQKIYAQAIANSGKVSQAQVAILNAQQEALLNLAGVDDELIKSEQTRLIQMGLTGAQVAKLTPLILDVAKATGKDLLTVTLAVGKAAEGNTTALARLGIILPKNKDKTQAYADTVAELNKRFGGTTQALSGSLDTRLAVLQERLQNVREEVGIKLLPVMTRIVDVVGQKLVPAFGQLLDQLLPTVLVQLNKLADFLAGGQATSGITSVLRTVKDLAPAIQKSAEITGQVIKTSVDLFRSLPPEIQSLAVAGLAINKLTGGLVTNLAGGLISAVISSFKGLMNVNAAVVNVNGPVAGGGGVPAAAGGLAGLGLGGALGLGAAAAVAVKVVTDITNQDLARQGFKTRFNAPGSTSDNPLLALLPFGIGSSLENISAGVSALLGNDKPKPVVDDHSYDAIENLRRDTVDGFQESLSVAKERLKLDRKADVLADRIARGVKDTGPSQTIAPRLRFLAGSASGGKDVAVANALASGFESSGSPAFRSMGALKDAIKAVGKDIRTLPPKFTKPLTADLDRLKNELKRRQDAAAQKTAAAAKAAGQLTAAAIKDKDLNVTIPVSTYINGRILTSQIGRYSTTQQLTNLAGNLR